MVVGDSRRVPGRIRSDGAGLRMRPPGHGGRDAPDPRLAGHGRGPGAAEHEVGDSPTVVLAGAGLLEAVAAALAALPTPRRA
jgi:hypothetical protein